MLARGGMTTFDFGSSSSIKSIHDSRGRTEGNRWGRKRQTQGSQRLGGVAVEQAFEYELGPCRRPNVATGAEHRARPVKPTNENPYGSEAKLQQRLARRMWRRLFLGAFESKSGPKTAL